MRLCDVTDKTAVAEGDLGAGPVAVACPLPSSSLLLSAGTRVVVLDAKTCRVEREVAAGQVRLTAAAANHNGSLTVHGDAGGGLGVTDVHRGEALAAWAAHGAAVAAVALPPEETSVWSLGRDGSLVRSSLLAGHARLWQGRLAAPELEAGVFCLGPEGAHCLTSTTTGATVCRLPGAEGEELEEVLVVGAGATVGHWGAGELGPLYTGGEEGVVRVATILRQ